jgi:hypothetical protein
MGDEESMRKGRSERRAGDGCTIGMFGAVDVFAVDDAKGSHEGIVAGPVVNGERVLSP